MNGQPAPYPCPFCGQPALAARCGTCGRDVSAPRRPCPQCKRMTPTNEAACMHCGARPGSEMAWKVPLIIFLFVVAFAISIALASAR